MIDLFPLIKLQRISIGEELGLGKIGNNDQKIKHFQNLQRHLSGKVKVLNEKASLNLEKKNVQNITCMRDPCLNSIEEELPSRESLVLLTTLRECQPFYDMKL